MLGLFDKLILPILTNDSEVSGFSVKRTPLNEHIYNFVIIH